LAEAAQESSSVPERQNGPPAGGGDRHRQAGRRGGRDSRLGVGPRDDRRRPAARPAAPRPVPSEFVAAVEVSLGVLVPDDLRKLYDRPPAGSEGVLYRPDLAVDHPMSMPTALAALADSAYTVPANLLPLAPIDDRSMAVVVCQVPGTEAIPGAGTVVRWHFNDIPPEHQAALVDVAASDYVASVLAEAAVRAEGLKRMKIQAAAYRKDYVEKSAHPKTYVLRPVQLACQNVIIGLAAFRHDSSFDGLAVPMWQTCEVPHVAAHEGARALSVLMLCDAFSCGGTMEIRFRGHPERAVPAALRRFARVHGVTVGAQERDVITPEEARALFLAVTPMPGDLQARAEILFANGALTPERLCYTLLAALWRDIEVDFMLAISPRVISVLAGGADPADRRARAVETELARAALLAGTLHRRLDSVDAAGRSGLTRVFEDTRRGITWSVLAEYGAVGFHGPEGRLPWLPTGASIDVPKAGLIVLPRSQPTLEDVRLAERLQERTEAMVALLVPADRSNFVDCPLPVLRCPDTIDALDSAIEAKLLTARVSRA
jgi:hypothetical protein